MKKGKLLVLGLITLMLAGGLALASCGNVCSGQCGFYTKDCSTVCEMTDPGCDCFRK